MLVARVIKAETVTLLPLNSDIVVIRQPDRHEAWISPPLKRCVWVQRV